MPQESVKTRKILRVRHMERNNSPINKAAVILLVLTAFGTGLYAVREIRLSYDSMRYALVSQQIAAGNGIKCPIIEFYGLVPDSNGNVPFIVQPPFFPAVLAMFGSVNPSRIWPGQLLNLLCHIAITIFSWLIARELLGNFLAFIVGLTVALSVSLLTVCSYLWSEPLFITAITASIYFLLKARHSKQPQGWLLAAGISASVAVSTRYAGIAILPLFVFEMAYLWKQNLKKRTTLYRLFCLVLPMVTTAFLLLRNKLLFGTFRGYHMISPGRSVSDSIIGVISHTLDELAIHNIGIDFLHKAGLFEYRKWVLLFTGILVIIWLVLIIRKSRLKGIIQKLRAGYDLIFLFIVSYALFISYGLFKQLPYFEERFFATLIPFILIVIVSILNPYSEILNTPFMKAERITKFLLLTAVVFCSFVWFFKNTSVFSEEPKYWSRVDSSETFKWLESNIPPNNIIATNYYFDVSFYGGYSTIALLSRDWYRNITIPENMGDILAKRMEQTRSEYLVLFADANGFKEESFGEFVAGLSRRISADSYEMVFNSADGVVYKLK
jgi:4-amino-4-deoxy-L-arabinose transferase-like glycosyltransferase